MDPDPHGSAFIFKFVNLVKLDLDLDPDPDPHSAEKLLNPDPHKMNADPQRCAGLNLFGSAPFCLILIMLNHFA